MIKILFTGVGRRVELIQAFRQAALVLNKRIEDLRSRLCTNCPCPLHFVITAIVRFVV